MCLVNCVPVAWVALVAARLCSRGTNVTTANAAVMQTRRMETPAKELPSAVRMLNLAQAVGPPPLT